jgi:Domain of unknown function (DUF4157)
MAEKTAAAAKTAAEPAARGGLRETAAPAATSTILGLQQTYGNRAVGRLLDGALLQPKLRIGPPGDAYEREADRVADAIVHDGAEAPFRVSAIGPGVQRACHCQDDEVVQRCSCQGKDEEIVQRCSCQEQDDPALMQPKTAGGPARSADGFEKRVDALRGSGRPLPGDLRAFFEPRFGHDFGSVRVHTGAGASQAADAVRARAFAVGNDVVFGGGEWSPGTDAGKRLIAHELTHIVQQTPLVARRKPVVQRSLDAAEATGTDAGTIPEQQSPEAAPGASPEPAAAAPSPDAGPADRGSEEQASADRVPAAAVVVDDETTTVGTGQMKKREFLTRLRSAVLESAETALSDKSRIEQARAFVDSRIADYEGKDAEELNRDLSRLIPDERPTTADGYISAIAQRVRTGVATWERTGEIPPEVSQFADAAPGAGGLLASLGGLFFKALPGGPRNAESPQAVSARLGVGRPLDGAIRSRMESAFGRSFAGVQVHDDATAAGLSSRFNARAFTIGRHVAFGAGEYRPGTIAGDALMAHELAHVAQQDGAGDSLQPMASASVSYGALERDADMAAVGAVASLWGLRLPIPRLSLRATPRLTSGLRLQRCSRCSRCSSSKDTTPTVPGELLDPPAPSSCCSFDSFEKSDDNYKEDQDCMKRVKFTVGMKPGGDEKKCVMVNWVKGFAKEADGTYHQAEIFGNLVELNLQTMQVDSVDTDPVYGSKDGERWRYNSSGGGSFWTTDTPGPTVWNDGSESNFNFKMCLYCIDNVSATSDVAGSGVSNPLKCIEWDYKAKYDSATDKCSH